MSPGSQTMAVIATVPILLIYLLGFLILSFLSYGTKGTGLIFLFFFHCLKHLRYVRHQATGIERCKDTPRDRISAWDFPVNVVLVVSRDLGSHRRPSRRCPGNRLLTPGDGVKIMAHRTTPFELGLVWLTYFLGFHITSGFPACLEKKKYPTLDQSRNCIL